MTNIGFLVKQYAMTRPHLIARLILAAMGVYLLMHSLSEIGSAVVRLNQNCPPETFNTRVIIFAVESVVTFILSLILLFRPDGLIRIIAGPDAGLCEKINGSRIIAGLQLTACFCGLLILYPRIERLFYYIPAITKGPNILSYMTLEGQSTVISTRMLVGILVETVKWVFAVYLIFGAPHYVRWQMRTIKVKEQNQAGGVEKNEQK